MTSFRRFWALAFVATIGPASAGAATIGDDPGHPVVIEAPPTFGSCNPPISTMGRFHIGAEGADITLSNKSSVSARDALTFDLVANGRRRYFWVPIDLRSGSSVVLSFRFLAPVEGPAIGLCGNRPIGIVEDPDPIVAVVVVGSEPQ